MSKKSPPIPKPEEGQDKEEYLKECISMVVSEGKPQEQAVAICNDKWRESQEENSEGGKSTNKDVSDSKKYADVDIEIKSEEKGMKVVLSKEIRDRDGEIVKVDGIDLSNFEKNPIMIWNHRAFGGDIEDVMGHWKNIRKENGALIAEPEFASHPKAQYLKQMIRDGHVRSVSVGFRIKEGGYDTEEKEISESELLEASWVMVPANVEARVQKGMDKEGGMDIYKKLLNYRDIHPKIKQYRNLFLSDKIVKLLEIEKTGDELVDLKNVYDCVIEKLQENPVEVKEETPQEDYVTRDDVVRAIKNLL